MFKIHAGELKMPKVEVRMPKLEMSSSSTKRVYDPVRWQYEKIDPFEDLNKQLKENEGELVKNNPKSDTEIINDYLAGQRTLDEILSRAHDPQRLDNLKRNYSMLRNDAQSHLTSTNEMYKSFVNGEQTSAEQAYFQSRYMKEWLETNARNSVLHVTDKNRELSTQESDINVRIANYKTEDKSKRMVMEKIFKDFKKICEMRSQILKSISEWKLTMPDNHSIEKFKRKIGQLKAAVDLCYASRSPNEGELCDRLYTYYNFLNDSCTSDLDMPYVGKVPYIKYLENAHHDINDYYKHLDSHRSCVIRLILQDQREMRFKNELRDIAYRKFKFDKNYSFLGDSYYMLHERVHGHPPEGPPPARYRPQGLLLNENVPPANGRPPVPPRPLEANGRPPVPPRPLEANVRPPVPPRPLETNVPPPEWYRPQVNRQEEQQPQVNQQEGLLRQLWSIPAQRLGQFGRWALAMDPPD